MITERKNYKNYRYEEYLHRTKCNLYSSQITLSISYQKLDFL